MSLTILRIMLVLGMIGHALNMYCDRILSIFPNGKLTLDSIKSIEHDGKMKKLMEGVSANIPLRSAFLGAFALFFEFLGYFALIMYMYGQSKIYGVLMFVAVSFFIVIGTAHHVKTALVEYVFIKLDRDTRANKLMLDLFTSAPITRMCFVGYLAFVIILIVSIVTGAAGFPIWAVIFTVLPIFIILFPFRIIGTLHIAAMVSMLVWMFLI